MLIPELFINRNLKQYNNMQTKEERRAFCSPSESTKINPLQPLTNIELGASHKEIKEIIG